MQVEERELTSTLGVLGGKASYTVSTSWGVLMPNLQVEWLHEFEDGPDALITRFVNDPTGTVVPSEKDNVAPVIQSLAFGRSWSTTRSTVTGLAHASCSHAPTP